jgi:hypothetical protein
MTVFPVQAAGVVICEPVPNLTALDSILLIESSDIGDRDTYSVCYQGQFQQNPNVSSAHEYCSDALTHHGEHSNVTLQAVYGDKLS